MFLFGTTNYEYYEQVVCSTPTIEQWHYGASDGRLMSPGLARAGAPTIIASTQEDKEILVRIMA